MLFRSWLKLFPPILIAQYPDELDKSLGKDVDFDKNFAALLQFQDGNRIDIQFSQIDYGINRAKNDSLSLVILDKDNLLDLNSPSEESYFLKKLSYEEFFACTNEFLWVSLYVVKGILRNQPLYALEHLNSILGPMVFNLLCQNAGIYYGFNINLGKCGNNLNSFLDQNTFDKYLLSFSTACLKDIAKSLFILYDIFLGAALNVSKSFSFDFNEQEALDVINYAKIQLSQYFYGDTAQ